MEWWLALAIIMGGLMLLFATGLPLAFCFMVVNVVGVILFWGGLPGLNQLALDAFSSITNFVLLTVVMFTLMGEVIFVSGFFVKILDILDKWLGRVPGRLGVLAVGGGTLLGALSGSSIGSAAVLGSTLLPEMERRGYDRRLSLGTVMSAGGLDAIIPPSGLAVILATLAEISVGKLLIAGILPGLLMAALYVIYIVGRCKLQPELAPSYAVAPTPLSRKIVETIRYVLPLGFVILVVTGALFFGVASPTEASAMGALSALILIAAYGKLNWRALKGSVNATVRIAVMIFMILMGATAFSHILSYSGATKVIVQFVAGLELSPIIILLAMQLLIFIMGCFMEQVSIMMVTFPLFLPVVSTLGIDPIWFGLIVLINIETGLLTPPFGLLLFVVKGIAPPDVKMGDVYRAVTPYVIINCIVMAIIILAPPIATWLPGR
ncbi:MAG: TRAP transporter large permease subunit [Chloroflexi bacterium]|nr:TRAP transporter large permease subunit [Chloroflexota bacterium]